MMISITINPVSQQYPGGTIGGDWLIEAGLSSAGDFPLTYIGTSPATVFDMTDGETYTIRGARLDAAGAVLGSLLTTQYTVGGGLVSIDIAESITVSPAPTARVKK